MIFSIENSRHILPSWSLDGYIMTKDEWLEVVWMEINPILRYADWGLGTVHAIFLKSTVIPYKKQKTIKWNVLVRALRTIALKRGHTRSQRSKAPQITIYACEFSFSREKIVSNFCLSEQCLVGCNLWIGKPVASMIFDVFSGNAVK